MSECSMRVRIADIYARFESDRESDIQALESFFKYHLTDTAGKADCTVVLKRQTAFYMPKDARMLWQSKSRSISEHPEGVVGRKRVCVSCENDTYGLATCYVSNERSEYYYGLMRDKSWICYSPAERKITYILHHRKLKDSNEAAYTDADPLGAMSLLIHVITTVNGRFLVHGAAVCIDGKASLLLGKSGSGKSTLCTDLAKQKASFMGDDLVVVYMKDGLPMVGSLLFPAKLYMTDDSKEKCEVDVPETLHTDYCLSAPLGAVYSVSINGLHASTVEQRTSAELLEQLISASNDMMMQYDKQLWLATMYDICERIPYHIFHFGSRSALSVSLLKQH